MLLVQPALAAGTLTFSSIQGSINCLISERVVREAYQRMGFEVIVKQFPAKRALVSSNEGKTDGELQRIPGINKKYPNLIMVPVPVNTLDGIVYTREGALSVNGWQSLKPYKIGIRRGIKFSEKGTMGMDRSFVNTNDELFSLLKMGKVDLVVISRVNGLNMSRRLNIAGIKALDQPIESYPLYHYLHQKNKHLVPQLTAVLENMEKEGVIKKIREQYLVELTR